MAYEYTNIIDLYNIQKSVSQKYTVYMYVYQSKHQFNILCIACFLYSICVSNFYCYNSVYQNLLAL